MSASARREQIDDFRERWMARAQDLAGQLGLPYRIDQASDAVLRPRRQAHGDEPDRAGAEIRAARSGALGRAADRLHELQLSSRPFRHGVESAQPKPAQVMHTGCVAFGMDRLALALFATHGLETAGWPEATRQALGL